MAIRESPDDRNVDGSSNQSLGGWFLHGVAWTAVRNYGTILIRLGVNVILARKLMPSEFGVLAMVVVYTGFVGLLGEAGLSAAVIQKSELGEVDLSTFFWFSVGVGLLLAGMTWFVAPLLESFYRYRGLASVVRVMAILFVFVGINAVPLGLLKKNMQFRSLAWASLAATILSGGAAIWGALAGWGYWALVVNVVAWTGLTAIFNLALSRWRPRWVFRPRKLRDALTYSMGVVGFNTVNYWARNADRLMVGKVLGSTALGYYSQGYKLLFLPLSAISGVVLPSLHPVLARIQGEPERMAQAYLRVLRVLSTVSFPLGAFFLVFAEPVVLTLWGGQWSRSVGVVRILAAVVMVQPPATTIGPVLLARNRTGLYFWLSVGLTSFTVVGMTCGLRWGIRGVAAGYVIAWCTGVLALMYFVLRKTLPISLSRLVGTFVTPTFGALVVMVLGWLVLSVLMQHRLLALLGGGTVLAGVVGIMLYGIRSDLKRLRMRET